jgi:hypothetical protein
MLSISLVVAVGVIAVSLVLTPTRLWPLSTAFVAFAAIVVDLARAHVVLTGSRSPLLNIRGALQFAWKRAGAVLFICLVFLVLHVVFVSGYGVGEVLGGPRVGGWRAVAAAQFYVGLRIVLRLMWGTALFSLAEQELSPARR